MKSRPKFLPELTYSILPWLYKRNVFSQWVDEDISVIQRTLAACCLVSGAWNRIFNPILYGDIDLGTRMPLRTQSLLHRTFRQIQPCHKALVKTMMIAPAEDGSTANLLSICFSMPNLRQLILHFKSEFNLSTLHPNFVQQLQSLSKCCTIRILEDIQGNVNIGSWGLLPRYIDFTRRSKSASCRFWTKSSSGR